MDFDVVTSRAFIDLDERGDLRRLETVCTGALADQADPNDVAEVRTVLAALKRDYRAGAEAVAAYQRPDFHDNGMNTPREFMEGLFARALGDAAKAQAAFEAARERAAGVVAARPDDAKALSVLARIDAELGRNEEAIREAERAVELLPPEKDELDGNGMLVGLASTCARLGEKDRAIAVLEKLAAPPSRLPYGWMKLHPVWDPLRGDARFEKIVASLAPRDLPAPGK
jgi:tetratricopeptide (TPR) repeat protein